nr:leucine-rich repeat domain-containing protein [Oscillospiraceae bacterium]
MKNKVVAVLVCVILLLVLLVGGALGFLWYRDNHIFVEGEAYPISARTLDLREEDISFDHYEAVHTQLPDCWILWNVPFQGGKFPSDSETLTVSSLTEEDVALLAEYFPELKTLDASACADYANLELYKAQKPDCNVVYQVSLGGKSFAPDTTELVLENGDYDLAVMLENLIYLPDVTSIQLKMPELTMEQVEQLRTAYEDISISCTVEILGREYDNRVTELDLRDLESAQVAEVAAKLPMLPNVTKVELTKENGTSILSKEEVKTLKDALPGASFHYTFDFYGETLSTTDEQVHIKHKAIKDEGIDEVRAALDLMENCQRFVLEYCQISYDLLAQVREEYRDKVKLVWRVEFGGGSAFTDVEVIRCTYDLVDDNCENLKYCEDVRFMDIGHNEWLDGVPFVAYMPKLEGIIASGAPIRSLEPFANCKNLKFLEIAFCEYIEDLTPLAGCESLQMLNMSNTHALDLSPLDNLPLTHLVARTNPSGRSRISQEEQDRFIAQHPDCWSSFAGAQPYGVGWRYDEDELTPLPYYAMLRRVFRYDASVIPNNVGWYLEEGITDLDYKEN